MESQNHLSPELYFSLQQHDIICGTTSKKSLSHPGNIQYVSLIRQNKRAYQSNSDPDLKSTMIDDIISQLAPARFLLPIRRGEDLWKEMPMINVRKKVVLSLNKPISVESTAETTSEVVATSATSTNDPYTTNLSSPSSSKSTISKVSPTTRPTRSTRSNSSSTDMHGTSTARIKYSSNTDTDPSGSYVSLQDEDIICGKAKGKQKRQGNIKYLSLIQQNRHAFQAEQNKDSKSTMVDDIISQLAPGRFVLPIDCDMNQLEEMSIQDVRIKIRNALNQPSTGHKNTLQNDDIICIKGTRYTQHQGNTKYQSLIDQTCHAYHTNPNRNSRSTIIDEIISQLAPGRFLRPADHHDKSKWKELPIQKIRLKIATALNTKAKSSNTVNVSSPSSTSTNNSTKLHSLQEHDVLLGSTFTSQNEHYYGTIRKYSLQHKARKSKNPSDDSVIHQVIRFIKKKGGRFLSKDKDDGCFKVVEHDLIVKKVNNALMRCTSSQVCGSKGRMMKVQKNTKDENNTEDKDTESDDSIDEDDDIDRYEGDYQDGKYHGEGQLRWDDFRYVGPFRDGNMNGKGKVYRENGEYYEGEFANDAYHGRGKYTWSNGDYYEGEYQNDTRCGKGTMVMKDGIVYSGVFAQDSLNGEGSVKYPNGNKWCGLWKHDHPYGVGLSIYSNGVVSKEEFNEEKLNPKKLFQDNNKFSSSSASKTPDKLEVSPDKAPMTNVTDELESPDETPTSNKPDEVESPHIKPTTNSQQQESPDTIATISTIATTSSPYEFEDSHDGTCPTSAHTKKRKHAEDNANTTTMHEISTIEHHFDDSNKCHEQENATDAVESSTKRRKVESQKLGGSYSFNINSSNCTIDKRSVSNDATHEKNETATELSTPKNCSIPTSHLPTEMRMHSQQNVICELRRIFNEGNISEDMKYVLQSDVINCHYEDGIMYVYNLLYLPDRSAFISEFIYQCHRRYKVLTKKKVDD